MKTSYDLYLMLRYEDTEACTKTVYRRDLFFLCGGEGDASHITVVIGVIAAPDRTYSCAEWKRGLFLGAQLDIVLIQQVERQSLVCLLRRLFADGYGQNVVPIYRECQWKAL